VKFLSLSSVISKLALPREAVQAPTTLAVSILTSLSAAGSVGVGDLPIICSNWAATVSVGTSFRTSFNSSAASLICPKIV
jgi:hypothetical protein